MKKAITLKKAISALLSAVTLSACVVFPASVNHSSGKVSLVNPIVADASVNTSYTKYKATGIVKVKLAKMYMYDNKNKKFVSYEEAIGVSSNVAKDTKVGILGIKGDYYLVSEALDGMWMKKSEINVPKTVTTTTTTKKPTTTTKKTTTTNANSNKGVSSHTAVCQYHNKEVEWAGWTYCNYRIFGMDPNCPPDGVLVRCKCCGAVTDVDIDECGWDNIIALYNQIFKR